MNIKESIEDLFLSVQDECAENRLKKYLQTYESWDGKWRLENLKLPEMDIMNAYGEEEDRN